MRNILFATVLLTLCQVEGLAQDKSQIDGEAIAREVRSMLDSFNEGKADELIEKTHPAIYKLSGGQKKFKEALQAAAKQVMNTGIKFESSIVEAPEKFYEAGDDVVCFLPKVSVLNLDGKRVKSTSFMIAARRGEGPWKYLDGAGLRKKPQLLWTFFPELDRGIKLPENKVELLE